MNAPGGPDVAIVIVSTDDCRWLDACLSAAAGVERAQVTLVLNDCHDDSESLAKKHGVATIRTNSRLGFAAANNLALERDAVNQARAVFLLNPDTILHPEAVDTMCAVLEDCPSYGVVGGWQIAYEDNTWTMPNGWTDEVVTEAAGLGEQVEERSGHRLLDHYYVQGAALMVRRSVLDHIGPLDPAFGTFYEETELCRRARLAGYDVAIVRDALVRHAGGGTWRSSPELHAERDRLMLRNQLIYELSGAPLWQVPAVTVKTVARQIGSLCRGDEDLVSNLGAYPATLWAAACMMPTIRRLRAGNRRISQVGR